MARDTVMAVATDSHRDFLIPELAHMGRPDNEYAFAYSDELRLFFCNWYYITISEKIQ